MDLDERPWSEHLAWCKERALEYVDRGDLASAVASMASDLGKHSQVGARRELTMLGIMYAAEGDEAGVRRWINGFN